MTLLKEFFIVGAGGFVGSVMRYLMAVVLASASLKHGFPYATLAVNVLGSFMIGFLSQPFSANPYGRLFVMVGVLGGFTTFSTFSNETLLLYNNGQFIFASLNVLLNVLLCLVGVFCGFEAAKIIL
ncbi:Integral membrane protein possibly involved in chromosome condensation [Elusimicrobium minutum Pei191]|uniref:Fluoride-specific ion channel FluC n=1 Tax=Elusimicrobium minutum (strain Pei191) TaxID=445932 RepID=FLUC_ELUMP|nr:fluoride efflux transporter CrcB [Elusimicrobium minutum]B2KD05.1 RecName: Full=Fluoride-specific ion channel FluC [Elusimicrobium minutum Pei191]ACC98401.1 Integral membrane protein possibly involved in chromosome condensation [Elusimicrobium minutum Pei191]